jgi:hypothetical protein
VLNNNDDIIYATPLEGSMLERFVVDALPIEVSIQPDEVSNVEVEVISTRGVDPESLGYSSLTFDIVPISEILVSVFVASNDGFQFSEAEVAVTSDGDFLNTFPLGDSINVLWLPTDANEHRLEFAVDGFENKTIILDSDTLGYYRTTPLEVLFGSLTDLESGLVAYYPFNGNANDESNNANDGVVNGATLVPDRFGNPDAAYSFDGVDDYILLGNSDVFTLGEYPTFTLSYWIKPEKETVPVAEAIFSKYISAGNNRQYFFGYGFFSNLSFLRIYENGLIETTDSLAVETDTNWHMFSFTYDNCTATLYVDDQKKHGKTFLFPISTSNSSSIEAVIGAVNFSSNLYDANFEGLIDDVRLYNRALGTEEIVTIFSEEN